MVAEGSLSLVLYTQHTQKYGMWQRERSLTGGINSDALNIASQMQAPLRQSICQGKHQLIPYNASILLILVVHSSSQQGSGVSPYLNAA